MFLQLLARLHLTNHDPRCLPTRHWQSKQSIKLQVEVARACLPWNFGGTWKARPSRPHAIEGSNHRSVRALLDHPTMLRLAQHRTLAFVAHARNAFYSMENFVVDLDVPWKANGGWILLKRTHHCLTAQHRTSACGRSSRTVARSVRQGRNGVGSEGVQTVTETRKGNIP